MSIQSRIRDFLHLGRVKEDPHDFLGVVMIDPRYNVLVLADHVAAILRVSGTDYLYAPELRERIVERWRDLLNKGGISVQAFIDRRPIVWDLEGGHLDQIAAQVDAYTTDKDSWEQQKFARYREAILNHELESQRLPIAELRQYVIIRLPMGIAESLVGDDSRPVYLPPSGGWRFWEQLPTLFRGRAGRDEWKRQAEAASRALSEEVRRFLAWANDIEGFRVTRAGAMEMTQLLHLLWLEDVAFEPGVWVGNPEMFRRIILGDEGEGL
jgi:hypothetical protein